MELKNRIVMTAAHLGYATPEGAVSDRLIDFYVKRAGGGAGLITVGGCIVDEYVCMVNMIRLDNDDLVPGLQRLTGAVKEAGAGIAAQICQVGSYIDSTMLAGRESFSASKVRSGFTGVLPRALEPDEIPAVQDSFVQAALRVKKAGFDAVEIHGGAGYLISQFLSPLTNLREDRYGGSVPNRMRFGIETVEQLRGAVGPDFPIIMRLSANELMPGGNTLKEGVLFAEELDKVGVDLFNVTVGWHESRIPQLTAFVPRSCFVYAARGIKDSVSVPVLACNRINDPLVAEEIIENGSADLVAMTRALIADPNMPEKGLNGKSDGIYHCVACNQGCFDRIFRSKPVSCLVNPGAGMEKEWRIIPVEEAKTVLVIGGGPAGMKAACVAAERGHSVTLVEKSDRLGGQLLLNSRIPGRKELVTVVHDLVKNLDVLGVKIILNMEADRDFVKKTSSDAVVLATGAVPLIPDIRGLEGPNVVQAWDLLAGRAKVGGKVVIIGGNAVGLETALTLANRGTISSEVLHFLVANRVESLDTLEGLVNRGVCEIIVVEMTGSAGKDIGGSSRWTVNAELKRLGVTVLKNTRAVAVNQTGLEIQKNNGESETLPVDSVVIAAGSRPENRLFSEIEALVPDLHLIGDAKEPRNALEALREGFLAGLKI